MRRLQRAGLTDQPVVRVLARAVKGDVHALHADRAQALNHRLVHALPGGAEAEICRSQPGEIRQQLPRNRLAPQRIAATDQERTRPARGGSGRLQDFARRSSLR